jgi:hypothetical protein
MYSIVYSHFSHKWCKKFSALFPAEFKHPKISVRLCLS